MIDFNEQLRNDFIRRGIDLARLESGIANESIGVLRSLADDLTGMMAKTEGSNQSQRLARLEQLSGKIADTVAAHYDELDTRTAENGTAIAKSELNWLGDVLGTPFGVAYNSINATPEMLKAVLGKSMIDGAASADWWAKQSDDLVHSFTSQMRKGILQGEPLNDLIRRIRGTRETGFRLAPDGTPAIMPGASRNAETLARTAALTVANTARDEIYQANADIIKSVQWHATLDPRTCTRCAPRDGQRWKGADHNPVNNAPSYARAPLHFNCRCMIIPVTYSWAELAKMAGGDETLAAKFDKIPAGTRASMTGQVPSAITYNDWLKGQSTETIKEVLGEKRAKLFDAGKISASDLINGDGRALTVAELGGKVGVKP